MQTVTPARQLFCSARGSRASDGVRIRTPSSGFGDRLLSQEHTAEMEIPSSKLQIPTEQHRRLAELEFGSWFLRFRFRYFSSTLQYASLRNRDQLSMRTSGEA